ncbi:MAG: acetolactate synthase large subunit [SAR324 cluster bacterium]|nr:acetolactate synthase large subunit [SAR324 cluster bacterium]
MNGAESLIRTLLSAGVDTCFSNPGTSEIHLVQAIDAVPEMRAVLALFEGVCTGAADGYGRMTGTPAATLLHLGPGLANGIANLHNARRASTPLVNLVGNHPDYHLGYDAPLTSDIETLGRNFSAWYKENSTAESIARDGADAVSAAMTAKPGSLGQISTLVIPADACWNEASRPVPPNPLPSRKKASGKAVDEAAQVLDANSAILLDGPAMLEEGLAFANRLAAATGCQVWCAGSPSRLEGGPGRGPVSRLPYFPEDILERFKGVQKLILAGSRAPVSFFAYQSHPSSLVPESCQVYTLAKPEEDIVGALSDLAETLKVSKTAGYSNEVARPGLPSGQLNLEKIGAVVAALMPDNTIFSLDSGGGRAVFVPAQKAAPHSWLNITGGAIGQGGPVAAGAAIAAPDRRVISLCGDGGAMYTNQALWTQAREGLDVTTVIFSNRSYGIIETEFWRLGVNEIGSKARSMFALDQPDLDWVALAKGMGVPAGVATTAEEFAEHLGRSLSQEGPYLIEALY